MKQKILNLFYKFLGFFARFYIKRHRPYVIGITGSVGKTSCRLIIYQILKKLSSDNLLNKSSDKSLYLSSDTLPKQSSDKSLLIYTSPKNFNGEYGLSLSILGIEDYSPTIFGLLKNLLKGFVIGLFGKKKYDILILEYGIDHPGEMDFLLSIVKPNISVITSIDKVHGMNFDNLDHLAREKLKLAFATKEVVFLNYDNQYTRQAVRYIDIDKFLFRTSDKKIDYFSAGERLENLDPDIWFENYHLEKDSKKIIVNVDLHIKNKLIKVKTNLIGKENIGYIGVGVAIFFIIAKIFGYTISEEIYSKFYNNLLDLHLLPGRFSILEGIKDSIIIDSSYNAAPNSMVRVIETVFNLKKSLFPNRKLILVLGDMRELGDASEQEHRKLAGLVSQVADTLFLVGPMMKKYFIDEIKKIGFSGDVNWFKNSKILGERLKDYLDKLNEPSIVLFKGSQNTIFLEEAIKYILKNKEDFTKLPRQDKKWQDIKEKFFLH